MITTVNQCIAVQKRRKSEGKPGYSKAVRTFLRRHSADEREYQENLSLMPVTWDKPEPAKEPEPGEVVKRVVFNDVE